MKIATYRRVSTAAQAAEDRYGLDRQQADLDVYVATEGHDVVAAFEDAGYSGASLDRPGILGLLQAAASGAFEAVVVPAWDRLARDTMLDGYLRFTLSEHGVAVLSATQDNGLDPASELTQDILRAVAKFERPLIKARLLRGRKDKARKGGYAGGTAPFGTFALAGSKRLHRHDDEFATLCDMKQMRDGGATLQTIADAMNKTGRLARNGGIWRPGTVQTALRGYDRASRVLMENAA
ncbi:MAG TPA: recombinase family protein [Candidatus Cybelea sp.]